MYKSTDLSLLREQIKYLIFEEGERTLDDNKYRLHIALMPDLYLVRYSCPLDSAKYGYGKLLPLLNSMSETVSFIIDIKIRIVAEKPKGKIWAYLNDNIAENLFNESKSGELKEMPKFQAIEYLKNEVLRILKSNVKPIALPYLHHELSKNTNQKIDMKRYGYEKFSAFISIHQ